MEPFKIFISVLIFIIIVTSAVEAGKGKRKHRRCRYNRSGSKWGKCDRTIQVKTKVAHLRRGKDSCPKTRTYTKPCDVGSIIHNGCEYMPVSDWSDCDQVTLISTRTLELLNGDTNMCDYNSVESRECGDAAAEAKRNSYSRGHGKSRRRGRKPKRTKKKDKGREKADSETDCSYQKGEWSDCSPTTGLQITVQKLKPGYNTTKCDNVVVMTRPCSLEVIPDGENYTWESNTDRRHKGRNANGKKRKKKKKGKKDKQAKRNKKKDKRKIAELPPRLTELHVVPYDTFVMVSWQPPQQEEIPIDGYQIGYGGGFPDVHLVKINASEFSYKIENLEPGTEYVISVRAQNHMGVGQALYETVITRDADGAALKPVFPPVGVRPTVLSPTAINVSWVDMSVKGQPALKEKRTYFVRYRQLNHLLSTLTPYHDRFRIIATADTHAVVDGLGPFTKYEFAVLASNGEHNSTWSMMVWNVTWEDVPSTSPDDLTVIIDPDKPGQVTLTWQPPSQANGIISGYQVSYSTPTMDGLPVVETVNIEGNKLSATLTTLIPGVTYDLSVRARNSKGLSPPLTITNYKLPGDPAPVPATLMALPVAGHPTSVALAWDVANTGSTNILGFVILYTSDIDSEHVQWAVESRLGKDLKKAVIENLSSGTEYYFKIQAHTSVGFGPESNTVVFQTPNDEKVKQPVEIPKKVQVFILSSTSAVVSWQDPGLANIFQQNVTLPKSTYTVRYRALDHEPSEYKMVSPPFTSVYLVELQPLTRYEFSVRIHRGNQVSLWSPPVENTTFSADFTQHPLKAEVKGHKKSKNVTLSWQPHSDSKIKEYVVMYSSDPNKPHKHWIQKAAVNEDVKQQVFFNLEPETTYFFFIQAMTDLGFGPRSKVVSYTTLKEDKVSPHIPTPENLQVIVVSANSVILSWHDPDMDKEGDKSLPPRTYSVRYRDMGEKSSGYKFSNPSFPSLFIIDLRPATQYEFSVRTKRGDHHSEWSPKVINTTLEAAPDSAPKNLTAVMSHDDPTSVLLSWRPPHFPNGEITGYQVFYTTDLDQSIEEASKLTAPANRLSQQIFSLHPQTTYFFRVGAENKKGYSPLSEPLPYKTPRVIGSPPLDLTVVPSPDNPYDAIVSWKPPANSKRKIRRYAISHHTEDGKHWSLESVPGSVQTFVVKDLMASTTYHFSVQAHYRRGAGPHALTARYSIPKELI